MAEYKPSRQAVQKAAQAPAVRKQLETLARKVAPEVEAELAQIGQPLTAKVETGTRPGWRPYAQISVEPELPGAHFMGAWAAVKRVTGRHNANT